MNPATEIKDVTLENLEIKEEIKEENQENQEENQEDQENPKRQARRAIQPLLDSPSTRETNQNQIEIKNNRDVLKQRLRDKIKGKSHTSVPILQASSIRNVLNAQSGNSAVIDGAKKLISSMNDSDIENLISKTLKQNGGGKKKLKKNLEKMLKQEKSKIE